jgi:hypothetical protein
MKSIFISEIQHQEIKVLAARESMSMLRMIDKLLDKALVDYRAGKGSEEEGE